MKNFFALTVTLLLALTLSGCSEQEKAEISLDPVAIHSGDECHVCGMVILEWPGPKAESINKQNGETLKFCSTTDLFAWWLQPENKTLQAQIYVHDMARAHWDDPEDDYLVEARDAWYVTGTDLIGAMGPTLVSFRSVPMPSRWSPSVADVCCPLPRWILPYCRRLARPVMNMPPAMAASCAGPWGWTRKSRTCRSR